MKNETGKPKQSESKKASAIMDYLELIISGKNSILKEFSDKQMIQNLSFRYSHNTVRNVRIMLEKENIIKKNGISINNEKFYKLIDRKKANTLYKKTEILIVNNRNKKTQINITPTKIIKNPPSNLNNNFQLILQINGKIIKKWKYPKIKFKEKICPVCSDKLIGFKQRESSHDLDKKCRKCKSKFYYNSSSQENIHDDYIRITTTKEIFNQFLLGTLVKKSKMDLLMKETKKIISM